MNCKRNYKIIIQILTVLSIVRTYCKLPQLQRRSDVIGVMKIKKVGYRVDFIPVHHCTMFLPHPRRFAFQYWRLYEGRGTCAPWLYKGPRSPVLVGLRRNFIWKVAFLLEFGNSLGKRSFLSKIECAK